MDRIPVEQLVAGQRLGRPVVTSTGVALLQPGAVLTPGIISRLASLGVHEVWVDEPPRPKAAPPERPRLEDELAALDARFSNHAGNSLMLELKAVIARQLTQMYQDHAG